MKKIAFILVLLSIFFLASCDFILAPDRGRENPNDPYAPIQDLRVYQSNPSTIGFRFGWPESWEEEGEPSAVWIFLQEGLPPDSVDDAVNYGSAQEIEWRWWSEVSSGSSPYVVEANIENINYGGTYYGAVFWTYDENLGEKDTNASWYGPMTDAIILTQELQTLTIEPTLDGYVNTFPTYDFTSMDMLFGNSYSGMILLQYDEETLPPFVYNATLQFIVTGSDVDETDAQYQIDLIKDEGWNDNIGYEAAAASDFISDSASYTLSCSSGGQTTYFAPDVTSLIQTWIDSGIGSGLRISSTNITSISIASNESTYDPPNLIFTWYGTAVE